MKFKELLKKTWRFIWYEDSLLSWIVNIILAFIIVKFLIYPGLGLVFGTSYPIVAVVSGSMDHNGNFDSWWSNQGDIYKQYNISKEKFKNFKFKNGFNKGDIMILFKAKNIEIGDVIVFRGDVKDPIIHRVIKLENGIQTKGDANTASRGDEINIDAKNIYGRAVFKVPYLGWIKLAFVDILNLFTGK